MKTIEQAAIEYENKEPDVINGEYTSFSIINAFKAGVEFAQRWIPVEEELPCAGNNKEFFLIKGFYEIKKNHNLVFTQLSSLIAIDENRTPIWSGINDDEPELFYNCVVTHWRPIEYK